MSQIPHLDLNSFPAWAGQLRQPYQRQYHAMYSSLFGGIVTDPALMMVPVDDHMVHRGDGVFETVKCVGGRIYNLRAHLDRLASSARGLSISLPFTPDEVADIVVQTVRAGGHPDSLVRILLSRGPGGLGVNPYECPRPGLYVVVSELKPSFMAGHPGGARVKPSAVPVKPTPFATIKSVNYLFNVLMKKEAVDAGVDFVVSFDERGFMAEGPTENFAIVNREGVLQIPRLDRILTGTTMLRVLDLSRMQLRRENTDITKAAASDAAEMLIFGTTPDVTAAVEFDGRPVGDGKPGPVFSLLSRLLLDDIAGNTALQTPVF
jgi:branched-subunit amino acid aminotransferase/4-amino-4-deoxychorismate lyase